jgi:hypothetical protein
MQEQEPVVPLAPVLSEPSPVAVRDLRRFSLHNGFSLLDNLEQSAEKWG